MNTSRLFARPQSEPRGLNSELVLRYVAATLVTLIALAAAQLVLPTAFVLTLGAVTLLGVPVALWMRLHEMRIGGFVVPRPLWNALTVMTSVGASAFFLRVPLRNILGALGGGMSDATFLKMSATDPMLLLVQLFLVFAAFRSFSIISDKDATLATVPSFSVLLLLIPVNPNIEVVCYFLVWTLVATMLFALDHRSEIHAQVTAIVPAPAPGQDVKLAARSLVGVLSFALVAAVALSGLLTARDAREGSSSDSAISLLASRLISFALQNQESSMGNGPQRQIDFASGTSLPTQAVLWSAITTTEEGKTIRPIYWRLFTLSDYNGSAWTQSAGGLRLVERAPMRRQPWPLPREESYHDNKSGDRSFNLTAPRPNTNGVSRWDRAPSNSHQSQNDDRDGQGTLTFGTKNFRRPTLRQGFDLGKALPTITRDFGSPSQMVRSDLTSMRASLGFLPLLPATTRLLLRNNDQSVVRARGDGSVDVSVVQLSQSFRATARVPVLPEYGFAGVTPPLKRIANSTNIDQPNVPKLSAAERASNLKLPPTLPARVRQLARDATHAASADSSNYARAQLLSGATQRGAIYTLRPPTIPTERDATDFFLFESRRGYCTYFAGALTVLCRAQGIPARVVSGFFAPEENRGETIIRDANAHAWTEVWIENWGWAVVDATPPDDRGDNAPTLLENWSDLAAAKFDVVLRWSFAHWAPSLIAGGSLLLGFVGWRFRLPILRRLGRETAPDVALLRRQISEEYARAARQLSRHFRPRQVWETPDEWLCAARAEVAHLPLESLQTLTAIYVRARFSPHDLSLDSAQKAREAREKIVWPRRGKIKR